MDKKKANGLQDNDIGFPNTPVRRYKHIQSAKSRSALSNPTSAQGWGDQKQAQHLMKQPSQQQVPQHRPQQIMQPQQVMQPISMQPYQYQPQQPMMQMQTQVPQNFMNTRPTMSPNMYTSMQNQNRAMHQGFTQQFMNMNYPQAAANQQQQMQNTANNILNTNTAYQQPADTCNKIQGSVGDGLDAHKREFKQFDPQASIMKQQQMDVNNNWQFANAQQEQYQTYQNPYGHQQPQQHQHTHNYDQAQQKPISPFTNSSATTNYQQNQGQKTPQADAKQSGDFENNPHLMGQNPNHAYSSQYPQNTQPRNELQQPSYYMNQPQPQAYQQQFQQPQMQT